MVALLISLLITIGMTAVIVRVGQRRAPGTPLTWGEAFAASAWVFALMFVAYGVVPHQWLVWADNELGWRSDLIGIPAGFLGAPFGGEGTFFSDENNVFFPQGIPLPNGYFIITAQVIRDIIASGIYIVFLGLHFYGWYWWQNRGKKVERPELVSRYGRPLVRKA